MYKYTNTRYLARGYGLRAGVEEDTAALGSVKVGELRAVRSLKARRLEKIMKLQQFYDFLAAHIGAD